MIHLLGFHLEYKKKGSWGLVIDCPVEDEREKIMDGVDSCIY